MPLALQALLPLAVLLAAALFVRLRPLQRANGWVATAATAIAATIALIELLRLAPGEHVDVPYLTTFPYADLMIRLDGLSLAFATVTLATAALLLLVRQRDHTDRRNPWMAWLLTSAAVTAVIMAGDLVLLYILLQVLTLAWSGAIDETAPRRRALRLTLQVGDIGLLLAAASAIQSVGTSSFSGVPSDTFGVASFSLMLLPVVVRIGAIAWAARRPLTMVMIGPAIVWLAPAAYVLLRLLALMAGRLPDRPTAVVLFGAAAIGAIVLGLLAIWARSTVQAIALLLAAQVLLALALSTGNEPVMTIASTWLWLVLIPLAGLVSVRATSGSTAETLMLVELALIPVSIGFAGVWLGVLALNLRGLQLGILPLALSVIVCAAAALGRIEIPRTIRIETSVLWAGAMVVIAAFPIIVMNPLVIPAASNVRLVPAGTVSATLLGFTTSAGAWPALAVSVLGWGLLALVAWTRPTLWVSRTATVRENLAIWLQRRRPRIAFPARMRMPSIPALTAIPPWARFVPWGAFALVLIVALVRP